MPYFTVCVCALLTSSFFIFSSPHAPHTHLPIVCVCVQGNFKNREYCKLFVCVDFLPKKKNFFLTFLFFSVVEIVGKCLSNVSHISIIIIVNCLPRVTIAVGSSIFSFFFSPLFLIPFNRLLVCV